VYKEKKMAEAIKRSPVKLALKLAALFVTCHMTTATTSHILCECVALAEFTFRG
jgi:hypothetical protein